MRLFSGDININNGAIYENFVAQELCAYFSQSTPPISVIVDHFFGMRYILWQS